jgi:hypothetical protein
MGVSNDAVVPFAYVISARHGLERSIFIPQFLQRSSRLHEVAASAVRTRNARRCIAGTSITVP